MKNILIILSLCLAGSLPASAQTDVTNNGTFFLTGSSDIFYITGSFTNASTAALTNNGNLYVRQHLANAQASMPAGTGTLFLNGTSNQNVTGTQPFKTNNLVTNNAAGITLNNDLSVAALHTFTNGMISTSSTPNYLHYESGASYTGDADTRHVNGWVRKTGTTNFAFPVGNGTVERRIGISSLAATSVFVAKYMGATTNPSNLASPLVTVDPNEYWTVNRVSGGTATVNMNWDNSRIAMPQYRIADIRVANYISSQWTAVGTGAVGNVTTTGTISSNTLSSFGSFTLGSISMIVPMHLIRFAAQKTGPAVLVDWTTTDERNLSHYEVLKSSDGLNFKSLAKLGAMNTPGIQRYAYTDAEKLQSLVYYRLKSIDLDGKFALSKIVTISNQADQPLISIVNPAHKTISITAEHVSGRFQYRIINNAGVSVQDGIVNINALHTDIKIQPSVTHGVYTLMIYTPAYQFSKRLLIE